MTDPSSVAAPSSTAPAAPQKASFWEDLIDIFFSPANVFRRNQDKSVWPPLLFVTLAIGVIFFATYNQLAPIFDAEFTREMAKQAATNKQLTPEVIEKMKGVSGMITRYGFGVIMFFTMFDPWRGVVARRQAGRIGADVPFRAHGRRMVVHAPQSSAP